MTDHGSTGAVPEFVCRSARSSVALHEEQMRRFLDVWRRAKAANPDPPASDDPDYASFDALLHHVFRWARTYLVWTCERLDLPDPGIEPLPDVGDVAQRADRYLEHVLAVWRAPLPAVAAQRFFKPAYPSPWGVPYCIDAMLEHAVMHPLKHRFQLEEWMGER